MMNHRELAPRQFSSTHHQRVWRQRGFTLIELMIIVVIIGVLATLAIFGVQSYIRQAKASEAAAVIQDIMTGEEMFGVDTHAYLNVTGGMDPATNFYPEGTFDGRTSIQWGGDGGCQGVSFNGSAVSCIQGFNTLGVTVANPVRFRYAVTTFAAGAPIPVPSTYVTDFNPSNVTSAKDGYVVVALSDLDSDGGQRTAVVGSSLSANLYMENRGD